MNSKEVQLGQKLAQTRAGQQVLQSDNLLDTVKKAINADPNTQKIILMFALVITILVGALAAREIMNYRQKKKLRGELDTSAKSLASTREEVTQLTSTVATQQDRLNQLARAYTQVFEDATNMNSTIEQQKGIVTQLQQKEQDANVLINKLEGELKTLSRGAVEKNKDKKQRIKKQLKQLKAQKKKAKGIIQNIIYRWKLATSKEARKEKKRLKQMNKDLKKDLQSKKQKIKTTTSDMQYKLQKEIQLKQPQLKQPQVSSTVSPLYNPINGGRQRGGGSPKEWLDKISKMRFSELSKPKRVAIVLAVLAAMGAVFAGILRVASPGRLTKIKDKVRDIFQSQEEKNKTTPGFKSPTKEDLAFGELSDEEIAKMSDDQLATKQFATMGGARRRNVRGGSRTATRGNTGASEWNLFQKRMAGSGYSQAQLGAIWRSRR